MGCQKPFIIAEIKATSAKNLFNAGITTEAYADLHLAADVGSSSLPSIDADLTLDWSIGLTTRDGRIGGGLPDIAIRDVKIDMAVSCRQWCVRFSNPSRLTWDRFALSWTSWRHQFQA